MVAFMVVSTWLILVVVIAMAVTGIFQLLWNTTMPELFGLKPVTLGQAFRLVLLAGLLLGLASWLPLCLWLPK